MLSQIAAHGNEWLKSAKEADGRAAQLGGQSVALTHEASKETRIVEFRGYQYTRTLSDVSGALMTRYDESKPQIWKLPLRDDVQPLLSIKAPVTGYLVPAAYAAWVGQKLKQHGVAFRVLRTPLVVGEFQKKLSDDPEFAKNPAARLEFFAMRHSSWDERFNLYPVMRTAVVPD